jgi:hypothetical protein
MMLAASDFRRHSKVSKRQKERPPAGDSHQRPDALLAHLVLAIPCRVASQQSPTPLHQVKPLYDRRVATKAP